MRRNLVSGKVDEVNASVRVAYSPNGEKGASNGFSCSTVGTETDADEGNDELQDADGNPTGRVAGDVFHSWTASA